MEEGSMEEVSLAQLAVDGLEEKQAAAEAQSPEHRDAATRTFLESRHRLQQAREALTAAAALPAGSAEAADAWRAGCIRLFESFEAAYLAGLDPHIWDELVPQDAWLQALRGCAAYARVEARPQGLEFHATRKFEGFIDPPRLPMMYGPAFGSLPDDALLKIHRELDPRQTQRLSADEALQVMTIALLLRAHFGLKQVFPTSPIRIEGAILRPLGQTLRDSAQEAALASELAELQARRGDVPPLLDLQGLRRFWALLAAERGVVLQELGHGVPVGGTDLADWRSALATLAPLTEPRLHMVQPRAGDAGEMAAARAGLAAARAQGNSLWTAHYALMVLKQLAGSTGPSRVTPAEAQALLAEADAAAAAAKAALPPGYLATALVPRGVKWEEMRGVAALRKLINAHAARGDATWRNEELRQLAGGAAGPATPA